MFLCMIQNFLSSNEITEILNHPLVKLNQYRNKVDFSIQMDTLKTKIERELGIHLTSIPMRWIKGDTPPHTDKGESTFHKTHLIYVTDSVGSLIIDGQSYPIRAGDAHVFHEGIEHSTINTGDSARLMIGPMSETGFHVGVAMSLTIIFVTAPFSSLEDAKSFEYTTYEYSSNYGKITMFTIPPPIPVTVEDKYEIANYSVPLDWAIPPNKTFGGWKFFEYNDLAFENLPIDGNPSTIYMPGETYTYNNYSILIPNWVDIPPTKKLSLQFTNNAQVYYKSNSLSTGSGGSGVRNYRHKQRKT